MRKRLSKNYYARKKHLKENTIPCITEIKKTVGYHQFLLKSQLSTEAKQMVGYKPKLLGPGDQLWIPPNSDLSADRRLCPVLTDHIKALTHHGVLGIGDKIVQDAEKRIQGKITDAIDENDELWKWILKDECRKSVKQALKKERDLQEIDVANIISEYSKINNRVMKSMEQQYHFKTLTNIEKSNETLKKQMCKEMEDVLNKQKEYLELEYKKKLDMEKETLWKQFDILLEQERKKFSKELCDYTQTLRHQLECRGMADVLYTACSERHHYLMKKSQAEKYFQEKYDQLAAQLSVCEQKLEESRMKCTKTMQHEQNLIENIKRLCKMIRKFLAYQFNVPPSQLGFLPVFDSLYNNGNDIKNSIDSQDIETSQRENNTEVNDFIFWKSDEKEDQTNKKPFTVSGGVIDDALLSKNIFKSSTSLEEILPELEPSASQLSTTSLETNVSEEKIFEPYEDDEYIEELFKIQPSNGPSQSILSTCCDSFTLVKDKLISADTEMTNKSESSITTDIYGYNLPPYMTHIAHESFENMQKTYRLNNRQSIRISPINIERDEEFSELNLKILSFHSTTKSILKKTEKIVKAEECTCRLHSKACCNLPLETKNVETNVNSTDSLKEKRFFKVIADDESWKHLEKSPEEFTKYTQESLKEAFQRNPSLVHYFKEKRAI